VGRVLGFLLSTATIIFIGINKNTKKKTKDTPQKRPKKVRYVLNILQLAFDSQ
jgi:hypothetical protein